MSVGMESTFISIESLEPNPDNVRLAMDDAAVQALAESIRESGVLQPLLVTPHGIRYRIIAGHRRYAAAQRVGLRALPCTVRQVAESDVVAEMLAENIQRENLTPIEEARGFDRLAATGLNYGQIAKRLGITTHRVQERLSLLRLPSDVQEFVHKGMLPLKGAVALTRIAHPDVQKRTALIAARGKWTSDRIIASVDRELKTVAADRAPVVRPVWNAPKAASPTGRRKDILGWLEGARGSVTPGQLAAAAARSCGVCGMTDAESVCEDCPMLELLEQLKPVLDPQQVSKGKQAS